MRGKRGGPVRLQKREDRAWLGALITGEGSSWARRNKANTVRHPCIAISMQDAEAIAKAAKLMGVTYGQAGISKASGNKIWRTEAVGWRVMKILGLIGPYLTNTKRDQILRAIKTARESGYMTQAEMRERTRMKLLGLVRLIPGSYGGELARRARLSGNHVRHILKELEHAEEIRGVNVGTSRRPRFKWYSLATPNQTNTGGPKSASGD